MCVPQGKLAAVSKPADVGKACCRLLYARYPRVGDEAQGDAVLAQQLEDAKHSIRNTHAHEGIYFAKCQGSSEKFSGRGGGGSARRDSEDRAPAPRGAGRD